MSSLPSDTGVLYRGWNGDTKVASMTVLIRRCDIILSSSSSEKVTAVKSLNSTITVQYAHGLTFKTFDTYLIPADLELLVRMEYESELEGEFTLMDGSMLRERR